MLFRIVITCVFLVFNVGKTFAIFSHQRRSPANNDLLNQPIAALRDYQTQNMRPSNYQNPQAHQNLLKRRGLEPNGALAPNGALVPNGAKCGLTKYNKQQLEQARKVACSRTRPQDSGLTTVYYPENPQKYKGYPPFWLHPIGNPKKMSRGGPHYGIDRVVLDGSCNFIGAVSEWPRPGAI
ncbi:hypothetical protein EPUL_006361, partial [Erysiphe pulchra]